MRYLCEQGDRLIVVNLGADASLVPASEPLLAPPAGATWQLVLSSEDVRFGGEGYRPPYHDGQWALTAASTSVFRAEPT